MDKLKMIVIGAGLRGFTYTKFAVEHPDMYEVVAVAEPVKARREEMKKQHNIPDDMCFEDWNELLDKPKFADIVLISTMDKGHYMPCLRAIEQKYDILLEKPVSPSPKECADIAAAAEKNGVRIVVCHVLRYTKFFKKFKELIVGGKVGKIATIEHTEGVGNVHQSHSFVRGNWSNSEESSPMILQKSCHDMDILQWLIDKKCTKVQSFGSLSYFNYANKPKGSPERCIEGCPYADTCYYDAVRLYLEDENNSWFRNAATKMQNPTNADVEKALRETDYGKCVYSCDNNVVDHQVVNLEFEGGITASFTMSAYNKGGRSIRIMGTEGELYGNAEDNFINFYSFATKETEKIEISISDEELKADHGGGDSEIMVELYKYLTGNYNGFSISSIGVSCSSHLIAFAAEKSRTEGGETINMDEYEKSIAINLY